jgi:Phospholipase A2.
MLSRSHSRRNWQRHSSATRSCLVSVRPVESIRSRSVDVAPTATVNTMPDSSVTLSIPMTVWNWAAQQTTPTHGLWTYGNWAGSGGMGVPTNNADAGAMMHDYCYHQGGFTVSVWSGPLLWVGVRVMYPHSVMWIHSSGAIALAGQR